MKLNHINLVVNNVSDAIHLFENHFNFKCVEIKGEKQPRKIRDSFGFYFDFENIMIEVATYID